MSPNELDSKVSELFALLKLEDLTSEQVAAALAFYRELWTENQIQNLTRLIEPADFIVGHLRDVIELKRSEMMKFPAMDLGSGCGVPGLLYAAIYPSVDQKWVLLESEKRKAAFLEKTADVLGLSDNVKVVPQRAEVWLANPKNNVESITARAVGPVSRLYAWIKACSTWNKLVLLKGPSWDEEWATLGQEHNIKSLRVARTHEYTVPATLKSDGTRTRKIVEILRLNRSHVPRGTS